MSSTPRAPISWGELIDKITILEIKSVEITDPDPLVNVLRELQGLVAIVDAEGVEPKVAGLKAQLKKTNIRLWNIEDGIRLKESRGEFDAEFVELARSVYKQNCERSRWKRAINLALDSEIVEEKLYKGS